MTELLLVTLIFLPVILAVLASALCWRSISRPWLFLATAILSLGGLQGIFAPVATAVFMPCGGEFSGMAANEPFARSIIVSAIFQFTIGGAYLWWLYRAFRKPV